MESYLLQILKELKTLRKHATREDTRRVIKVSDVIERYVKLAILENEKKNKK